MTLLDIPEMYQIGVNNHPMLRSSFAALIKHRMTDCKNLLSISSVVEPDPSPDPSPDISPDMSIAFESPGFAKVVISSVVSVPF